jgi:CBS domain-containing protein
MGGTVRDVMTTRVVAVKRNASFKEIVSVLRRFGVGACPVINDAGKVLGVVSEADLLHKEAGPNRPSALISLRWRLGEQSKATAESAGRLMTSPAVTIGPGASLVEAARLMQNRHVKQLPVVDGNGLLIGVLSRADVLSVYERPDSDIGDEVKKVVLDEELGLDPDEFDVTVFSGVVTVAGTVPRRETALSVLTRVRQVDGVIGVRDRLSYPAPGDGDRR